MNEISQFLIDEWELSQKNALSKNNYFSVALSGGNTPKHFFQKLSEQKDKFNWEKKQESRPPDEQFVRRRKF